VDDVKRDSLRLIIELAIQLPALDCGMQLLHVVRQFVDAGEMVEARAVLRLIPTVYFTDYLQVQALGDSILRDDVARLIEVLGLGFWFFARPVASA
jgi:hypothetical protein